MLAIDEWVKGRVPRDPGALEKKRFNIANKPWAAKQDNSNLGNWAVSRLAPSEEDRMLLLSAAVQGLQFDSAVVARVLSRDPAGVEERLQALDTEHDFVRAAGEREFSDGTPSVRYHFIHVFYQHALYEWLAPSRRIALSLETARSLVKLTGARARTIASDLALLFEAGRDPANASEHFLQAARNAARPRSRHYRIGIVCLALGREQACNAWP